MCAALMATRTAAQLPLASVAWAPTWAETPRAIVPRPVLLPSAALKLSVPDSSPRHLLAFQPVQADPSRHHKSPVLAWFLSWLVPGGGQGYNGQWSKAAAFFVPAAVGFGLAASNDGFSCSDECGTRDVGLVILAAASIGSQIDAPITASRINRDARQRASPQVSLAIASIGF
jgi:hypothetical protein